MSIMSMMPPPDEFIDMSLDLEIYKLRTENESLKKQVEELTKERDELEADLMLWKAEFHIMNRGNVND